MMKFDIFFIQFQQVLQSATTIDLWRDKVSIFFSKTSYGVEMCANNFLVVSSRWQPFVHPLFAFVQRFILAFVQRF
jgi:hypothetical protein